MKKDVYIKIKGSQSLDGDSDTIEVTTQGHLYTKEDKLYLSYTEGELSGLENCKTTLKVAPCGSVTMIRNGKTNTHMVFEKGKRHIGHYETPYGDFTISVVTNDINVSLTENGGNIDIDYMMDINNVACTHNGISLSVRA